MAPPQAAPRTRRSRSRGRLDPVTTSILWSRLLALVDEAAATLIRTSFSTIVREVHDMTQLLTDDRGLTLAQSAVSTPGFVGTTAGGVRRFLELYGTDGWRPGDVAIRNVPWIVPGPLPDVRIVTPVFHRRRLVAFMANTAHMTDIGGTYFGVNTSEVFEEGLRIPPLKLVSAGHRLEPVWEMIRANVRAPDQVIGDIRAQIAANAQGARPITAVLQDTRAYAAFTTKCAFVPAIPNNEGLLRRIVVEAPRGSICNAVEPAPVQSRHVLGFVLQGAIFAAFAQCAPGHTQADSGTPPPILTFYGTRPDGESFVTFEFVNGGVGGKLTGDGRPTTTFTSYIANLPIEILESIAPVLYTEQRLIADSGGVGLHRGGLGQRKTLHVLSPMMASLIVIGDEPLLGEEHGRDRLE